MIPVPGVKRGFGPGAVSSALASCSAASGVQTRLSGAPGIVRSYAYADDIHLVSEGNRRSLRSSSDNMCAVSRTHNYNSYGDRSFGAAGPRIWNSLPCGLRTVQTF